MDNEYIVMPPIISSKSPFKIMLAGITYENPDYVIERYGMDIFTVEYVISGRGYIELDGKKYTAEAGDSYILNYNKRHYYYADKVQPWKKIWFNATGPLLNEAVRIYGLDKNVVLKGVDTYGYLSRILEICENNTLSPEEINRKCSGVYIELLGYMAEKAVRPEELRDEAVMLKKYIDLHTEKNISVSELAKLIYRSESQTIRIFKRGFNKTPYEYLLENKILNAKTIIQNTNMPIKEIAYRFGFADEHYFSAVFRKKTGKAPTEYRKIR